MSDAVMYNYVFYIFHILYGVLYDYEVSNMKLNFFIKVQVACTYCFVIKMIES